MSDATVSPWLSCLLYPLGCHLLIPSYFGKLDIIGREHIPRTGPVLLAPTHRSRWDALIVPYTAGRWKTGRDLRYMVSENETWGLQGWFIRRMGGFPVDPRHPGLSTIRQSVEILSNGEVLVIFPEGDIFREKSVQPLKPGIARIALQAESKRKVKETVKIVPISIHYSRTYPQWGTDVKVKVGFPLDVANYDLSLVRKTSKRLTSDLEEALRELYDHDSVSNYKCSNHSLQQSH